MVERLFGRYSENYKSLAQIDLIRQADEKYKQNKILESYVLVFEHLQSSESEIKIQKEGQRIHFQFFQGRSLISGTVTEQEGQVMTKIASLPKLSAPVLRKMLEVNFQLRYSKIILDEKEENLTIEAFWEDENISPAKLIAILREVAHHIEKSEILRYDFPFLNFPATDKELQLSENEKKLRYQWIIEEIKTCIETVKKMNNSQLAGGVSYILMSTLYRIDFFTTPYAKLQADIETIHGLYFADNDRSLDERNRLIIKEYEKILAISEDQIKDCFYKGKSVFALTRIASMEQIAEEFSRARTNYSWYKDNNYLDVAVCALEYAITYNFFNYSMPLLVAELLQLALQIGRPKEWTYFSMGDVLFDPTEARFSTHAGLIGKWFASKSNFDIPKINQKIKNILQRNKTDFPDVQFQLDNLKYNNLIGFYLSFFSEIEKIKFE